MKMFILDELWQVQNDRYNLIKSDKVKKKYATSLETKIVFN